MTSTCGSCSASTPDRKTAWAHARFLNIVQNVIAKRKHDRFGASSERGRKLLDQLELELGELVAAASEDAA